MRLAIVFGLATLGVISLEPNQAKPANGSPNFRGSFQEAGSPVGAGLNNFHGRPSEQELPNRIKRSLTQWQGSNQGIGGYPQLGGQWGGQWRGPPRPPPQGNYQGHFPAGGGAISAHLSTWKREDMVKATEKSCAELDVNYYGGKHFKVFPNGVLSWQQCGEYCNEEPMCRSWVWTPHDIQGHKANGCWLHEVGYTSTRTPEKNIISGTKGCP